LKFGGDKDMKKYVNGEYLDMTEEEIAELMADRETATEQEPTLLERIEAIESAILEGVLSDG